MKIKYENNFYATKEAIKLIIEDFFSLESSTIQKIYDKSLNSLEYYEYVKQYFELFKPDKLPEPESIFETTVERQMNILINECFDHYKELIFKNKDILSNIEQIPIFHNAS